MLNQAEFNEKLITQVTNTIKLLNRFFLRGFTWDATPNYTEKEIENIQDRVFFCFLRMLLEGNIWMYGC